MAPAKKSNSAGTKVAKRVPTTAKTVQKRKTPMSLNSLHQMALKGGNRIVSGDMKAFSGQEVAVALIYHRVLPAVINMDNVDRKVLSVTDLIDGNSDLTALGLETSLLGADKRKRKAKSADEVSA